MTRTQLKYLISSILGAIIFIIALCFVSSFWFTVNQKEVAVVTKFKAFERIEGPGLHFKNPFTEDITPFHVATQQIEIEHSETYTADNQGVNVTMLVQFDVPESDVKNLFERFPNYEQRMITLSNDKMKEAFGKRQVADIPSSRADLETEIQKSIGESALKLYGLQTTAVQIIDLKYSQTFMDAIDQMTRAKAEVTKAEQLRQQAEKDALRAQIAAQSNADAEVKAAKGHAEAMKAQALAEADAIRAKGEAEAAAISAKSKALNASPEMVQYEQASRWDGKLPQTMFGNTVPLINLGK